MRLTDRLSYHGELVLELLSHLMITDCTVLVSPVREEDGRTCQQDGSVHTEEETEATLGLELVQGPCHGQPQVEPPLPGHQAQPPQPCHCGPPLSAHLHMDRSSL